MEKKTQGCLVFFLVKRLVVQSCIIQKTSTTRSNKLRPHAFLRKWNHCYMTSHLQKIKKSKKNQKFDYLIIWLSLHLILIVFALFNEMECLLDDLTPSMK